MQTLRPFISQILEFWRNLEFLGSGILIFLRLLGKVAGNPDSIIQMIAQSRYKNDLGVMATENLKKKSLFMVKVLARSWSCPSGGFALTAPAVAASLHKVRVTSQLRMWQPKATHRLGVQDSPRAGMLSQRSDPLCGNSGTTLGQPIMEQLHLATATGHQNNARLPPRAERQYRKAFAGKTGPEILCAYPSVASSIKGGRKSFLIENICIFPNIQ